MNKVRVENNTSNVLSCDFELSRAVKALPSLTRCLLTNARTMKQDKIRMLINQR